MVAISAAAVVALGAGAAALLNRPVPSTPTTAAALGASPGTSTTVSYGTAPSYTLTDQLGRTVSSASFAGKVQVVTYLFPYCTSYCPLTARTLTVVAKALSSEGLASKVAIVSFNVDPTGAGPAQMRAFMAEYGADPQSTSWQFLTGTAAQVHRVVEGGFHVYYQKVSLASENAEAAKEQANGTYVPQPVSPNPLASQAHVTYDIVHNDFIEIVDGRGKIVRIFQDGSTVTPAQLLAAIAAAA